MIWGLSTGRCRCPFVSRQNRFVDSSEGVSAYRSLAIILVVKKSQGVRCKVLEREVLPIEYGIHSQFNETTVLCKLMKFMIVK